MSRCAFQRSLAHAALCVHTGKQTHPGELTVKTHLCLLPFNFLPHRQTRRGLRVSIGGCTSTVRTTVTQPSISVVLTHTQAKIMTSILQAQTEAAVLAANNSQFSRHPRRKRGRTGRWERNWEEKRKKNLRERIGVFILSWKIMTHLGKELQQGERVCLPSGWSAEPCYYNQHQRESAEAAIHSQCRSVAG